MSKRRPILIAAAILAGALLWHLFRPDALVISKTVNEPFPGAREPVPSTSDSPGMGGMPRSTTASPSAMGRSDGASLMAAGAQPQRLVAGRFHTNAHETTGLATVYRLDGGRRVLRLTEFATSNGPDVRVYLIAADDVQEEGAAKQAGFVDLGALKGNIGDQNYDVPEGLDLTRYRAVSIWCRRFSVNFGAAPLRAAS
jgi:hypothetical protein